jgi:hypothetical protein
MRTTNVPTSLCLNSGFLRAQCLRIEDVGDDYREDYEDYVAGTSLKPTVTPTRYDFCRRTYIPGYHPASHMHIEFKTEIRIHAARVLRPLSFALWALSQCYPDHWRMLTSSQVPESWCGDIRDDLDEVEGDYFTQPLDDWEMRLV